jgi:hypothetical protein
MTLSLHRALVWLCFIWLPACAQNPTVANPAAVTEVTISAPQLYEQCTALQTNEAAPAYIAALKESNAQQRIKAATLLAKSCDARATEALLVAFRDEDTAVRMAAVEALGQLGDRAAIDPLCEDAANQDWRVRAALARTLASFQVYRSSNVTLNTLANPGDKKITDEGDMRARCLAILAVNQLRDVRFSRKAIGFLFTFQDHPQPALRRLAEAAARELQNTRNGYHELAGLLKQSNFPLFRLRAAYWLGQFNTAEARAVLAEIAATDRDPSVQRAAQEALAAKKP